MIIQIIDNDTPTGRLILVLDNRTQLAIISGTGVNAAILAVSVASGAHPMIVWLLAILLVPQVLATGLLRRGARAS